MVSQMGSLLVGGVPAVAGGRAQSLGFVESGHVGFGAVRNAGGVGQQILDRDRALGGNDG